MDTLGIEFTRQIKLDFESTNWTVRSSNLREAVGSFTGSLGRVIGLSSLTLGLFNTAWKFGTAKGELKGRSHRHPALVGVTKEESDRIEKILQYIHDNGSVADLQTIENGLGALLSGMIVGMWTAVEILAEDIWATVVDLKPESVLSREAKPGRLRFDKEVKCLELIIPWDDFKKEGFSLGGKFSMLLRDKYKFDSFERISDALEAAFSMALESFDTGKGHSLFRLAKLRNAIVHAGAKVDAPFYKSMVDTHAVIPEFSKLKEGDPIPLDGKVTHRIVSDSISSVAKLIQDADSFLQ